MSDTDIQFTNVRSPLTKFIVALMKKPLADRMKADPQKAAMGYGLPLPWTTFWIEESRKTDEVWPISTKRRK